MCVGAKCRLTFYPPPPPCFTFRSVDGAHRRVLGGTSFSEAPQRLDTGTNLRENLLEWYTLAELGWLLAQQSAS